MPDGNQKPLDEMPAFVFRVPLGDEGAEFMRLGNKFRTKRFRLRRRPNGPRGAGCHGQNSDNAHATEYRVYIDDLATPVRQNNLYAELRSARADLRRAEYAAQSYEESASYYINLWQCLTVRAFVAMKFWRTLEPVTGWAYCQAMTAADAIATAWQYCKKQAKR